MILNKKGQGLSLNVIIVAALALIVLVILVAVFTGRIGSFTKQVSQEADTELITLKIQYADCHPSLTIEKEFKTMFSQAGSENDKGDALAQFKEHIRDCSFHTEKDLCESALCAWK